MNHERADLQTDEQGSKCLMGSEHRPRGSAYPLQARSDFECGEKVGSNEGCVCECDTGLVSCAVGGKTL